LLLLQDIIEQRSASRKLLQKHEDDKQSTTHKHSKSRGKLNRLHLL